MRGTDTGPISGAGVGWAFAFRLGLVAGTPGEATTAPEHPRR